MLRKLGYEVPAISNVPIDGRPETLSPRLTACLECGARLDPKRRGRPRLWCSDRCRKRFAYRMEYLVVLGVMREFRLESHPASRLPTGRCLKCGRKLRRTGYRPQLYCDEKCRSAFRRARVAFVE